MLPDILPEYEFTVLSTVYDEVRTVRKQLDNQIYFLKNIRKEAFCPKGDMLREYAVLVSKYGRGESACMAYCRFTRNVIGSSNLRDIRDYCSEQNIVYLTTIDFLYYAYVRKLMTLSECKEFIETVRRKGSKLPDTDLERYVPEFDI